MHQKETQTELTLEEKRGALTKAIQLCHANLYNEERVLKYLHARGISDTTANVFRLGAFPADVNVLVRFVGKRLLIKCGLINIDKDTGVITSKFETHKLIIPIYDATGDPVAIIGRSLISEKARESAGLPKYINTFYKKSQNLFGLNLTKDCIREKGKAFVVEGNFDVITAYQNGMRNIVASSGAFLSNTQVAILSRYTDDIRLLLDNDDAGRLATERVLKKYQLAGMSFRAAKLPDEVKDLDEYFKLKKSI